MRLYLAGEDELRVECTEVEEVTPELLKAAEEIYEFLIQIGGPYQSAIGLAANQVGRTERFFVLHQNLLPKGVHYLFVNPRISAYSTEEVVMGEGCLSLLFASGELERPGEVELRYTDKDGERKTLKADGVLARVIQHEMDHLDGILYTDYLSRLKRKLVMNKFKKRKRKLKRESKV